MFNSFLKVWVAEYIKDWSIDMVDGVKIVRYSYWDKLKYFMFVFRKFKVGEIILLQRLIQSCLLRRDVDVHGCESLTFVKSRLFLESLVTRPVCKKKS